jgi:hypothetical protein
MVQASNGSVIGIFAYNKEIIKLGKMAIDKSPDYAIEDIIFPYWQRDDFNSSYPKQLLIYAIKKSNGYCLAKLCQTQQKRNIHVLSIPFLFKVLQDPNTMLKGRVVSDIYRTSARIGYQDYVELVNICFPNDRTASKLIKHANKQFKRWFPEWF